MVFVPLSLVAALLFSPAPTLALDVSQSIRAAVDPLAALLPSFGHTRSGPSLTFVSDATSVQPAANSSIPAPLRNFQVNIPPLVNPSSEKLHECKIELISYVFANSYGQSAVFPYTPSTSLPSECRDPTKWVSVVLEQNGTSQGRQFDRLGTIWVGNGQDGPGLELWRTDNPEPTKTGIVWTVKKDVSRYYPTLRKDGTMIFDYPNIVDDTYTGSLNITLSMSVYVPQSASMRRRKQISIRADQTATFGGSSSRFLKDRTADVIVPLSTRSSTSNSLFTVGGSNSDTAGTTKVTLPNNARKALVEITASGTAQDEFWYTSVPDQVYNQVDPIDAANFGLYPRGPFREVQLLIDGKLAGFVLPYAVIFTGGINPLLWRPESSYGAWDQPAYYIDVTPWLGALSDGATHDFQLRTVSAEKTGAIDSSWFVSGNLQLSLDPSGKQTKGKILKYEAEELPASVFDISGSVVGDITTNGTLTATVRTKRPRTLRIVSELSTGGSILPQLITWTQSYTFSNTQVETAAVDTINQTASGSNTATHGAQLFIGQQVDYPLNVKLSSDATTLNATVDHAYHSTWNSAITEGSFWLPNRVQVDTTQNAGANSILSNGGIAGGNGTTTQTYQYNDNRYSFGRTTSVKSYLVTSDKVSGNLAPYADPVRS